MHDCRRFEDGLVDLVFDALDVDERRRRLAELDSCDRCLAEYTSAKDSLLAFDRALEASLPDERHWSRHHEKLRQVLAAAGRVVPVERVPFLRRWLSLKISLPAPAAAVVAIALMGLSVLAVQRSRANAPTGTLETVAATTPPARLIELPVIREKVQVRTVYVTKILWAQRREPQSTPVFPDNDPSLAKQSGEGGLFTRANLTDFQPPDEMKIRVIKRSNNDEN